MPFFEDLRTMVEIDSQTGHKAGVDRVGSLFEQWLKPLGYQIQRHRRQSIGDHLHFLSPRLAGQRTLLLGHLDTILPPAATEPFREDAQWVHGSGVCDMKGGLIVALQAVRSTHEKCGSIGNVDFLLVSDEEAGSDDSKNLTKSVAADYDHCFVFEAAGPNGELVTGRKGVGTFTLDFEGRAAHAGNNYLLGIDANLEAARTLQYLSGLTDLTRGTTVNVGKMAGGVGANTISPQASLTFEIRYRETDERDRLLNSIRKMTAAGKSSCQLTLGGGIQRDVMEPDARQAQLFDALATITGTRPATESRGGVSDANITSAAGLPTLDGFGPFGDGDHTPKERALKESFFQRIDLVAKILIYQQQKKYLF